MASFNVITDLLSKLLASNPNIHAGSIISLIADARDVSNTYEIQKSVVPTIEHIFGKDSQITQVAKKVENFVLKAKIFSWFQKIGKFVKGISDYMKLENVSALVKFTNLFVAVSHLGKLIIGTYVDVKFRMKHVTAAARADALNNFVNKDQDNNPNAKALKDFLVKLGKEEIKQKDRTAVKKDKNGEKKSIVVVTQSEIDKYKEASGFAFIKQILRVTFYAFWDPKSEEAVKLAEAYPTYWQFARYTIWKFLPDVIVTGITALSGTPFGAVGYSIFISTIAASSSSVGSTKKSNEYFEANAVNKGLEKLKEVMNKLGSGKECTANRLRITRLTTTTTNAEEGKTPDVNKVDAPESRFRLEMGDESNIDAVALFTKAEFDSLVQAFDAANKVKKNKSDDGITVYSWTDYVEAFKSYVQETAI